MKKTLLFFVCLFSLCAIQAQKISNVDFDSVKLRLDADESLYKKLIKRFVASDTTLTKEEYRILYYGQCFQDDYNPYGTDYENFDKFKVPYEKGEFDKALPFALKMIEKNPMDMKMTFKTIVCYHSLKNNEAKKKMLVRYDNIMMTIYESGNGRSKETAMVVMCVPDEYEIMANMQVQNLSQSLADGCDVMTLKDNDYGISKLYFNVSKLLQSMMKSLEGGKKEKN